MIDTTTPSKGPLVSIIVDGYNESRGLGKASDTLEALQGQTFPMNKVELVLIGTSEQVKNWEGITMAKQPFGWLKVVTLDGAHYLELKNHGAECASGSIIVFTDSDVYPQPMWLASIVEGMEKGADVVVGLSLFKQAQSWRSDTATRQAAASITWGWVLGKGKSGLEGLYPAAGFMDHNVAFRRQVLEKLRYRTDLGRILGAPLFYRALVDMGAKVGLHPSQRIVHFYSWRFWLHKLHFRYGYEVFNLRRLDAQYPNRWIARTMIFEPVVTMVWHVLLDMPRWFRVSRLLGIHPLRRLFMFPLVFGMSCLARTAEMAGMYATMVAPETMRRWAESV
jgi:glycosyltransferase involved in cell wall biosynthesis